MELGFKTLNNNAVIPELEDSILTFYSAAPAVLQPAEIKRIRIGLAVQVEEGYSLQVGIHPSLQEKDISVFPGPLVIDSLHSGELFIPLQNNGRGQINILPGEIIAKGVVIKIEEIEITELVPEPPSSSREKTKPQKKDIEFKVHGR